MKYQQGQSLLEVVLVTFLFGIVTTGLLSTLLSSSFISSRGVEYSLGSGYIQEAIEAVRSIRNRDWSEMVNGTHGLTTMDGYYDFSGTSDLLDDGKYTRTITIEDVYRTASLSGDIAQTGILDAATKRVTVNVTWEVPAGLTKNIDAVFYVTNWDQESWIQTLTEDFALGFENSTDVTTASNGEVVLRPHNADWELIQSQYRFGLSGDGDRGAIFVDPNADLLYVLAEPNAGQEFDVLDVSDVSRHQPTVLASMECSSCNNVAVYGGNLYIAAHESSFGAEVAIFNASTLASVGTIDLPGSTSAQDVTIEGDTLVVVRGYDIDEQEMVFYDITDPTVPVFLGGADVEYSLQEVTYNGTVAFATSFDDTNEVTVIRQSNFSVVDSVDLSGTANTDGIDLFGQFVYVGKSLNTLGGELYKIDVSDPESMTVASELEVGNSVNDLQVDSFGTYLVAATRYDTKNAFIVDLSTFLETHSGDLYGGTQAESASVFGGHVYAGTTTWGSDIEVFHVSPGGWGDTRLVSSVNLSGNHDESSVWVDGNYVYMATENNGANVDFYIYDISTPTVPTYLGSLDTHSDINDVLIYGNYAYIATKANSDELMVIDITTKTSPVVVGTYNAAGSADGTSLTRVGTTLYLGRSQSSDPELYALDLTDPTDPTLLGSLQYGSSLSELVADTSTVYAATSSGSEELAVFDVTNPAMMSQIGSLDLSGSQQGRAIALSGNLLAIGRDDGGEQELVMIDVSTPGSPLFIGGTEVLEDVSGIAFENASFLHVSTDASSGAYQRYAITDPAHPTLDTSFNLESEGKGIFFNGVYAFVATEDNASELKIVGPGSTPSGYAREGNFTSQAFDAGSDVSWDSIEWTLSGTGSVSFRIRTADSQEHLQTATWVGSDGTEQSTYTVWGQSIVIDPNATGRRWFQWKALLTGDGTTTPALEEIIVRYSQ